MRKHLFRLFGVLMVVALAGTGCIFGTDDDPDDTTPTAPTILSTDPDNGDTMVEVQESINVIFSIPMDTASVRGAVSLDSPTRADVPVEISWLGNMVTFDPYDELGNNTLYTLTIDTGATSAGGAALESTFTLTFTTEPSWPVVLSTLPDDGDVDVALNAFVMIEFSRDMNFASVEAAISIDPVVGFMIDDDDDVVTLTFDTQFDPNTLYTVTIDETAQAAWGGETLPADYVFSFTTGTNLDEDPPYIVSTYP
ncbi:MAG: Ig-like domain-containing protein, partial [Actinomycetia bacterium]|nr:Ig-like domain-containing protein [Actinomycetes bacterium]